VALVTSARLHLRPDYGQYFVGAGNDYDDVRRSDWLQRLALILGISGYWTYIAVAISVAVGLGIGTNKSSSKCLPFARFLYAAVRLFCLLIVVSSDCVIHVRSLAFLLLLMVIVFLNNQVSE